MKKIIIATLSLVILLTFACCGKKDEGPVFAYRDEEGNIVTGTADDMNKDKADKNKDKPKNRDEIVEVNFPLALIEEEYQNDLDKYAEAYGYKEVKLDKKTQTVKIKMTAMSYDLLLVRIGTQVMRSIGSTYESEEFPYMLGLGKYNDDFSEVEILVDKEKYQADEQSSLLPYAISEYCMFYQLYTTREECACKVTVRDKETNRVIETKQYNQANLSNQ